LGQIISQSDLILQRENWKRNGEMIVFVSGCFDLLHPGHIRLLEQARSYGDKLVVGVQSDAGVKSSKSRRGANDSGLRAAPRPITPDAERAEILADLAAVDYVVEFDEKDAMTLTDVLHPEIVVVSSSAERTSSSGAGGHFKVIQILREPGYSTEQLLSRIVQHTA
jgi:rfaE bifunctional protein nucleotidyltransferase chain/domain